MSFEALEMGFEAGHGRWGLRHLWQALGLVDYGFFFFPSYLMWLFLLLFFFYIFLKFIMCHMVIGCCKMISLY